MRRTKEEAELTRRELLKAAFRLFNENGYDRTTLEQICRLANVTRGAAYWHFKNKFEIFEHTVREKLSDVHRAAEQLNRINSCMGDEEIIVELLWLPQQMAEHFIFLRKTMTYVQGRAEFAQLKEEMLKDKLLQYEYFLEPIRRIKQRNRRLDPISTEELTFLVFYAFDGIYTQDIPREITIPLSKGMMREYVHLILG